jgi:hypothetical protein
LQGTFAGVDGSSRDRDRSNRNSDRGRSGSSQKSHGGDQVGEAGKHSRDIVEGSCSFALLLRIELESAVGVTVHLLEH